MKSVTIVYQSLLDWLEKGGFLVAMILTGLLFLNTANGIIVEQVTGSSLVWVEEINNLLFAWSIFVGAGVISRRGGHIGVDILYLGLRPKYRSVLHVVYAALALVVAAVMVIYGYQLAKFVGRSQTSLYLSINLFWYYLSVPVGGLLLGLFSLGAALPDPRKEAPRTGADRSASEPPQTHTSGD
ncbi:TRAP transporter small permease [Tropicimonas sp. IMCC6043]|uniref:TRAP transporter small permease n=1 Tax=Tropicimonas sp. IMCC6043 TaxID=2510645 RepID=UPI0013EB5B05|nr:TRAP transporter small permease subunit [Tropicimonas sp. IMCC6043]